MIKVIGVGGGGSNAVNHMKRLGINGVDFVVCNTDAQALEHSPVENKIQLGANLTEGLGAGANPEVGERAAMETVEEIKNVLQHNTKMLFITAGMGGGTGTGAAPIIAKVAQELGILTVGIVTIPFAFEGKIRLQQAKDGIEKFKQNLDSLIVINNNKLREVYGNLGFKAGFAKADEVLATAAKGIAEVITHHYTANIDLKDAKTVLANSGTAIMGSAKASGPNRAMDAIRGALDSPLLNDNHIVGAQNVLLLIVCGSNENEITFDEIGEVNDYIQNEAGGNANIIMGIGEDEELNDAVSITIIATGFSAQSTVQPFRRAPERVVHTLDDAQDATEKPIEKAAPAPEQPKAEEKPVRNHVQPGLFDFPVEEEPEAVVDPVDAPIREVEHEPEVIGEAINENLVEEEPTPAPVTAVDEPIAPVTPTTPVDETPIEAEPAPEQPLNVESTEERVVFELGDFDLGNEDDFVIEDEPTAEPVAEEVQEEAPAEEETDVFEFSIDEAFTPSSSNEASMEWEVHHMEEETSAEVNETPAAEAEPEIRSVTSEEAPQSYEEVRFQLNDELEEPRKETLSHEESAPIQAETQPGNRVVHTLDDLRELEERLGMGANQPASSSKKEVEEKEDESLKFEVHRAETPAPAASHDDSIDPLDRPIQETMHRRNEERLKRLKQFNYKFQNLQNHILESEKEPAYKRQGLEIDHSRQSTQSQMGSTSIGGDGNDIEFRSNNSFLHDNVD